MKILARQEVPAPVAGMFYQAVVAAVLLYGSESWVLPPSALKVLEGFHVEAARRMTGMRPQRRTVGAWVYPKSADVLAAARLRPVATYIRRRRHHIATTIEGRTLLEECRGAERRSGSSSRQMWWQQEMTLEEDDDGHFFDAAGNEVRADSGQRRERGGVFPSQSPRDPHERHMERPARDAASEDFVRGVDLDG